MDDLLVRGDETEYHWTLTGTNTGPEGTGRGVRLDCLIAGEFRRGQVSLAVKK